MAGFEVRVDQYSGVAMHVMGYRVPAVVLLVAGTAAVAALALGLWLRGRGRQCAAPVVGAGWYALVVVAVVLAPSSSKAASTSCVFAGAVDLFGWRGDDQRLLNVLLFVPLGVAAVLLPRRSAHRCLALAAVAAASPLLELIQLTPAIGRSCSGVDVVDNWFGLVLGAALGGVAMALTWNIGRPDADHT